jgi:hypothetical protein
MLEIGQRQNKAGTLVELCKSVSNGITDMIMTNRDTKLMQEIR